VDNPIPLRFALDRIRRPSPCLGRVGIHDSLSGPAQSSLALWPAKLQPDFLGLLSGRLRTAQLPKPLAPVATGVYHQLPGQDFHLQDISAFTAHLNKYDGAWVPLHPPLPVALDERRVVHIGTKGVVKRSDVEKRMREGRNTPTA